MKKTILLFLLIIFRLSFTSAQTNISAGNVSGSWTMTGSPYLINGTIQIPSGQTLTIDPGVTVNFQDTFKLKVQGSLIAIGTAADTIVLTANNITKGWQGIRFDNTPTTNDTSKFIFCKLKYGKATGSSPDDNGGAFYFNNYSKAIISNCLISNCKANNYGGAIYCNYGNPIISNNIIRNNDADYSGIGLGGGIYCKFSYPKIIKNKISNNSAFGGGGIYCDMSSHPAIINDIITNNSSYMGGGGISCYSSPYSNPTVTNCSITNNTSLNGGGAIDCSSGACPTFINCIFWGNTAAYGVTMNLGAQSTQPNFYFCDVQGDSSGFSHAVVGPYTGTYLNNVNINPLFVAPSTGSGINYNGISGDWSLQWNSPCINSGNPDTSGLKLTVTDLAENPRINGGHIDMGAYEYQGTVGIYSDSNSDQLSMFPNPATNNLTIETPQQAIIEISNTQGQIIKTFETKEDKTTLDVSGFSSGVYIVSVETDKGVWRGKFVKE